MADKLSLDLTAPETLSAELDGESTLSASLETGETLEIDTVTPVARQSTSNYERLANLPSINGVTLLGNKTSADLGIHQVVSENTTEGWASTPLYVPRSGEICVYTDRITYLDDQGRSVAVPDMKVGDGHVPVVDLPFVSMVSSRELQAHVLDTFLHVTAEDRARWDAKLNYDVIGENLTFTRK